MNCYSMPVQKREISDAWNRHQFFARFPDEDTARQHMERMRWNNDRFCPHCGSARTSKRRHKSMPYRCKDCRKEFSVRTGTVLAKAKLSLQKCLLAIYLLTAAKKEISTIQLAKELGCKRKTARCLEHRLREVMKHSGDLFSDEAKTNKAYVSNERQDKNASKKL